MVQINQAGGYIPLKILIAKYNIGTVSLCEISLFKQKTKSQIVIDADII